MCWAWHGMATNPCEAPKHSAETGNKLNIAGRHHLSRSAHRTQLLWMALSRGWRTAAHTAGPSCVASCPKHSATAVRTRGSSSSIRGMQTSSRPRLSSAVLMCGRPLLQGPASSCIYEDVACGDLVCTSTAGPVPAAIVWSVKALAAAPWLLQQWPDALPTVLIPESAVSSPGALFFRPLLRAQSS